MLKLKLQYFGHLMRRTDSLEKTLLLGKIKGIIEDLKFFKKLKKRERRMIVKIVKIYLGLSLVLLWTKWGQFIFR